MDQRAAKKFITAPRTMPTSFAGSTPIKGVSRMSDKLDEPSDMAAPDRAKRTKDFSRARCSELSNVQRELTAKEKETATAHASKFARSAAVPSQARPAKTAKSMAELASPTTMKRSALVERREGGVNPFMR